MIQERVMWRSQNIKVLKAKRKDVCANGNSEFFSDREKWLGSAVIKSSSTRRGDGRNPRFMEVRKPFCNIRSPRKDQQTPNKVILELNDLQNLRNPFTRHFTLIWRCSCR
ncbi:hypothetical protein chiPu_0009416 [Chiloscyllium punctatum]|uniref:Uncharacterized protein n=1 Tax=Chiloscyllium punctatum TaxID=137246 RepID=A0A401SKP0_CHIPU|nr:hypothetical protein [Chiloscyllium punctatum]